MRRQVRAALGAVLAVGLTLVGSVAPAAARTKGNESFRGVIVASGSSGTRTLVSTLVVARGVFTGAGRIVEVKSRPGDPENLFRDDFVFPRGRMHIRSTNKSVKMSLNPRTCAAKVRIRQTTRVQGRHGQVPTRLGHLRGYRARVGRRRPESGRDVLAVWHLPVGGRRRLGARDPLLLSGTPSP